VLRVDDGNSGAYWVEAYGVETLTSIEMLPIYE
jgi:hypothetical protein